MTFNRLLSRCFVLILLPLLIHGCAASWQKVDKDQLFKGPSRAYVVTLPAGWKRAPTVDQDHLLLTRDGLTLQSIAIYRFDFRDAFKDVPAARTGSAEDMDSLSPEELATMQLAQLRAGLGVRMEKERVDDDGFLGVFSVAESLPTASSIEQIRLVPARVDGRPSFSLTTVSYNNWGLKYNTESYGFVHEGSYWLMQYSAPDLHWWADGKPVFEVFKNQIRLKKTCFIFCGNEG